MSGFVRHASCGLSTSRPAALLVIAVALAMTALLPASAVAAPDEPRMAVRVTGNHLADRSGDPLVLRGINVSGTEFACIQGGTRRNRGWSIFGGQPLDQRSTFEAARRWKVNTVRVPLNEDCWLGINGVNRAFGGSTYRTAIKAEVAAIHAAGLYAVLDLHWSAPGRWAAYAQQPMADADHSLAFWRSIAATFRSDPAVIFDLFNEPYFYWIAPGNSDPWTCWLNGCRVTRVVTAGETGPGGKTTGYTVDQTWRTAGMQQLVNAVRGTGATQPILVNGVDWANDDSGWLSHVPRDPADQLVAGWHSYPGQACAVSSCWNSVIAPIAAKVPVVVGETGDSSSGPVGYLPTFLPWADTHGVSYLAWTWNPWSDGNNVLIKNWSGTPTTGQGRYYRAYLEHPARQRHEASHAAAPNVSVGHTRPPPTASPPWWWVRNTMRALVGIVAVGCLSLFVLRIRRISREEAGGHHPFD